MFFGTMKGILLCAWLALVGQRAIATTPDPKCDLTMPVDIVFILDASGSVNSQNFQKLLTFVNKLVDTYPVNQKETHIGEITFDTRTYLQFYLNKYYDKTAVKSAVSHTRYTGGATKTYDAIKFARVNVFSTTHGMRSNATQIAIIVTDGQSDNERSTIKEAIALRHQGVTVFSIGVGIGAKTSELNGMATDPDNKHVFTITDYSSLDTITASLARRTHGTCEASHVCHYGGHDYQEGETFRSIDGCNICECNQHMVDCTARSCI